MYQQISPLSNENGSIMVVSLLVLVFITLVGIAATTTSSLESQIAGNNQQYKIDFYAAETGWHEAAMWLEGMKVPPGFVDVDSLTIKYFGVDATSPDPDFAGTPDGAIAGTPYWYRVVHQSDIVVPGHEATFRNFFLATTSNGNRTQTVGTRLSKIYKEGYK
jgi:hypothetical protein